MYAQAKYVSTTENACVEEKKEENFRVLPA